MFRFSGVRDLVRREKAEKGEWIPMAFENGATGDFLFSEYRKKTTTFALQMPYDFEVDTLEGLHSAHAGDYLAIGQAGEMYPIAKDIFEQTYELVEKDDGTLR